MVERVKTLQELGCVMIFRAKELYTMSAYANRYTKSRIHFAIRLSVLVRVLEDRYKDLAGNLLEGIARLFTQNVRLSSYPMASEEVRKRVKMAGPTGGRWKEIDGTVSRTICIRQDRLILSTEFIIPGIPGKRAGFEGPIQMDG